MRHQKRIAKKWNVIKNHHINHPLDSGTLSAPLFLSICTFISSTNFKTLKVIVNAILVIIIRYISRYLNTDRVYLISLGSRKISKAPNYIGPTRPYRIGHFIWFINWGIWTSNSRLDYLSLPVNWQTMQMGILLAINGTNPPRSRKVTVSRLHGGKIKDASKIFDDLEMWNYENHDDINDAI